MGPRLPLSKAPGAATAAFLDALRAAGFEGDLSASGADRTVLATDNSIYRLVPRAIAFRRGTADLARTGRMQAEPRFAGVRIARRGTGTNRQSLTNGMVGDVSRRMTHILEINAALAPHGLCFAPELSTSNCAAIGGMVIRMPAARDPASAARRGTMCWR